MRDYSSEIRVSQAIEMATHQGDLPPCVCSGIAFEEGRGRGAAWVRFNCHHCGRASSWSKVTTDNSQHRSTASAGLSHTQTCWAIPQATARARGLALP